MLDDAGLSPTSSVDLGAGIALANADLTRLDAAVVVLPAKRDQRGLQAVLVETGIAAGRDLPLLVIVPPDRTTPTALASMQIVRTELTNREALSLHVGLFAKSLEDRSRESLNPPRLAPLQPEVADTFENRLASLSASTPAAARSIEEFVVDLLSSAGAQIEPEHAHHDRRFDAAAFVPGEEGRLGLLIIEVKARLDPIPLS